MQGYLLWEIRSLIKNKSLKTIIAFKIYTIGPSGLYGPFTYIILFHVIFRRTLNLYCHYFPYVIDNWDLQKLSLVRGHSTKTEQNLDQYPDFGHRNHVLNNLLAETISAVFFNSKCLIVIVLTGTMLGVRVWTNSELCSPVA